MPLQTVCVRHTPSEIGSEDLDEHTLGWADRINRGGKAYLTPAVLDGQWMVRVSIGSETTTLSDVKKLWQVMKAEAERNSKTG